MSDSMMKSEHVKCGTPDELPRKPCAYKGNLTLYGEFCQWLDLRKEKLTGQQEFTACVLLGAGSRSGKSWLIDRLYEFDRFHHKR